MNTKQYIIICFITLLIGMLLCALHYEWIVFRVPIALSDKQSSTAAATKKNVRLYFWQHNKWKHETHTILWTQSTSNNCIQLINALLNVWEDEKIITKKIRVESVALNQTNTTAYISFDRNPLPNQATIFKKWHLIESILKTVKENNLPIQHIQFLVYHEPLVNYHLDFSAPWPINGFEQS